MFRPNCRAIFRLIFEQVECTIDNAFDLRDLVLKELVKNLWFMIYKRLKIKIWCILTNKKPNRCHLLCLLDFLDIQHVSGINVCPSSGVCDYVVELPHWPFRS